MQLQLWNKSTSSRLDLRHRQPKFPKLIFRPWKIFLHTDLIFIGPKVRIQLTSSINPKARTKRTKNKSKQQNPTKSNKLPTAEEHDIIDIPRRHDLAHEMCALAREKQAPSRETLLVDRHICNGKRRSQPRQVELSMKN